MLTKVINEQPFQVLTGSFSISPSETGYELQISADGVNYSPLFTVSANVTRLVSNVASGSYYRLKNNVGEVIVNWNRSCGGGGSEGSGGTPYILPIASASELGGVKVGDGLAIDPSTGVLSVSGGSQGGDSQVLLPSSALPQDVWVSYDDNQFDYVREDIVNDGVYLMHWDDNNLYCGVDVAGGVITGSSYYMTEGQDGVWHSNREGYENIIAWVEGGKIYWKNPYENVSMLDAYDNGTNKQGCSVEVDVENGTVRATTDGLFQYDGMEWKQIDNSLLNPVSELPSNSVDGAVFATSGGVYQLQGEKTGYQWTTLEDWTETSFSQVRLPYAQSAGFAIRYPYEGGPHQDVGFEWNGSTWDTGFNTGTITDGEWSGSENGMTGTCVHSGDYLIITFTGQPIILSWNWNNAEAYAAVAVPNYVKVGDSDFIHLDSIPAEGEEGKVYEYQDRLMVWNPTTGKTAEWLKTIDNLGDNEGSGLIYAVIPEGQVLFECRYSSNAWNKAVFSGDSIVFVNASDDSIITAYTMGETFEYHPTGASSTRRLYGRLDNGHFGFRKGSSLTYQNIWDGSVNGGHFELIDKYNYPLSEASTGIPEWNDKGQIIKKTHSVGTKDYYINTTASTLAARTTVITNGTGNGPSRFFAPETVGTQGQILKSVGDGAPQWATMITALKITSAAYEALVQAGTTDPNTLYLIVDE